MQSLHVTNPFVYKHYTNRSVVYFEILPYEFDNQMSGHKQLNHYHSNVRASLM